MDAIVDAAIWLALISLGIWLLKPWRDRSSDASQGDDSPKQVPPIESQARAENSPPRREKTSPITRTDGDYPDSYDLILVAWVMHTPIKLSKPAKTPTGGRPTVVTAIVDVRFRVRKNTLEIISGRLCQSFYFSTSKTNVSAVRRGETWLADYSLECDIGEKLPRALETELQNESQFRRALWGRYFHWARDEKSLIP